MTGTGRARSCASLRCPSRRLPDCSSSERTKILSVSRSGSERPVHSRERFVLSRQNDVVSRLPMRESPHAHYPLAIRYSWKHLKSRGETERRTLLQSAFAYAAGDQRVGGMNGPQPHQAVSDPEEGRATSARWSYRAPVSEAGTVVHLVFAGRVLRRAIGADAANDARKRSANPPSGSAGLRPAPAVCTGLRVISSAKTSTTSVGSTQHGGSRRLSTLAGRVLTRRFSSCFLNAIQSSRSGRSRPSRWCGTDRFSCHRPRRGLRRCPAPHVRPVRRAYPTMVRSSVSFNSP